MMERRPKRGKGKGKAKISYDICRGRKPAPKYQKKLVVIDYMGSDAPRSFGLKESYVLMRGLLPEIAVSATEGEVRTFIRDTIRNSEKTLSACLSSDFEYMEASGKCVCTPAHQADFEWSGRAVKQLAGAGAVYVRLVYDRENNLSDESSDSSSESTFTEPDVKVIKVECEGEHSD